MAKEKLKLDVGTQDNVARAFWLREFGEKEIPEDICHFSMSPIVDEGQTGYNASGTQVF